MIEHRQETLTTPSRVVVLGASGFVGGDLVNHLRGSGIDVMALSSRDVDLTLPESVEQLQKLHRPGDVVVMASTITPDRGRDVRTLMRNLSMGEHVAAFLEKSACAHLVYISSDAVYDEQTALVRENTACNPTSFHGVMHLARERMLSHAASRGKIACVVVRATLLYGAADTHNGYGPNRFLRSAVKEGIIKLFGQGEEKRDHVYIHDLSRVISGCIRHRSEGVLNVATGHSASFREAAELIVKHCSSKARIECLPRGTAITHRHFDVTRSLRAFPSLSYSSLEEGLIACIGEGSEKAAA